MSENERNEAVEKIIENITAENQNNQDGQYNSLGFTAPPPPPDWPPQYSNTFNLYNPDLPAAFSYLPPCPGPYLPQPPLQRFLAPGKFAYEPPAPAYQPPDDFFHWMQGSAGSYSPFGDRFAPAAFDLPRAPPAAKPARPSYSDVLTKPVAAPRAARADAAARPRREGRRRPGRAALGRSSTSGELRGAPAREVRVERKRAPLARKWASLDSISGAPAGGEKKKREEAAQRRERPARKSSVCAAAGAAARAAAEAAVEARAADAAVGGKAKPSKAGRGGQKKVHEERQAGGKRGQRTKKRENHLFSGVVGAKLKQYLRSWWRIVTVFLLWLYHLISDVCTLSVHISKDAWSNFCVWQSAHWALFLDTLLTIINRVQLFSWIYEKFKKEQLPAEPNRTFLHAAGLQNNINMPTTGDEAMKRLLACKGKDPYSILGVTPSCTDDDIKKYYKKQAFLVHPDKNQQPGAEEAFKILVHAFDMIGVPEKRSTYDKGVVESAQVEQAWSELNDLLAQLQQKVAAAANTICCSACGQRHKRVRVERPAYAARNCAQCQIRHTAREGDIWAEARCFGFIWNYYACMKGDVYDITEWAGCQRDSLKHLRPDSHQVQYRIALGRQPSAGGAAPAGMGANCGAAPNLENLLSSFFGQGEPGAARKRGKKPK